MYYSVIVIILAYILDLILGDPRWLPHPVKGIGWMAKTLEPFFRKLIKNGKVSGAVFNIFIVSTVYLLIYIANNKLYLLNEKLSMLFSALLIYTSLSVKDLKVESMYVYDALRKQDINLARQKLSFIVGRDTENISEKEIIRATVETVSENIVDGIISPLFYAFIGGAPLAMGYKAINTLDSVVGYKNDKYRDFGWFSAKIDDFANFIPARLSAIFLPFASWFAGKDGYACWQMILRDGKKNPSPNSGISEAGVAGALGVQLGGLNFYNSVAVSKPLIGNSVDSLEISHIRISIKIAYIYSFLFFLTGLFYLIIMG